MELPRDDEGPAVAFPAFLSAAAATAESGGVMEVLVVVGDEEGGESIAMGTEVGAVATVVLLLRAWFSKTISRMVAKNSSQSLWVRGRS